MRTQPRNVSVGLVALALLLAACGGPTNGEVIAQYQPQFGQLRAQLQQIAAALPASSAGFQTAQPLDPAPDYDADAYDEIRNTDILMFENLIDPDLDLRESAMLDLSLSRYLRQYMQWTGPHSPMGEAALGNRAPDGFAEKFERALQIRYLGVARVVQYEPPVAVSAESFSGGYAQVQGFLVDLQSGEVLCAFGVEARPNEVVNYRYEEGEDRVEALEEFAHSTLWENARQAFVERMGEACGGSFTID